VSQTRRFLHAAIRDLTFPTAADDIEMTEVEFDSLVNTQTVRRHIQDLLR